MQTGLGEEEKDASYTEDYCNAVFKLLNQVKVRNIEVYWDLIIESLLKHFAREKRGKKSKKPDHQSLEHLETLYSEYFKTSGVMPEWLEEEIKWAREQEEFENYLELLKIGAAHFGHEFEAILMLYIIKHHGEAYWRNLCISHSHKEK